MSFVSYLINGISLGSIYAIIALCAALNLRVVSAGRFFVIESYKDEKFGSDIYVHIRYACACLSRQNSA